MRLIKRLVGLEAAAAAAVEEAPLPIGIVWTRHETRVDSDRMGPGEFVALDIIIEDPPPVDPDEEVLEGLAPLRAPQTWIIHERVTREKNDLGRVHDAAGGLLGFVCKLDGSLITWEAIEAATA